MVEWSQVTTGLFGTAAIVAVTWTAHLESRSRSSAVTVGRCRTAAYQALHSVAGAIEIVRKIEEVAEDRFQYFPEISPFDPFGDLGELLGALPTAALNALGKAKRRYDALERFVQPREDRKKIGQLAGEARIELAGARAALLYVAVLRRD